MNTLNVLRYFFYFVFIFIFSLFGKKITQEKKILVKKIYIEKKENFLVLHNEDKNDTLTLNENFLKLDSLKINSQEYKKMLKLKPNQINEFSFYEIKKETDWNTWFLIFISVVIIFYFSNIIIREKEIEIEKLNQEKNKN